MKINLNESKTLDFNMDTSGCSAKDLQGFLRFNFDGVEYGFPAVFEQGGVKVEIPPFKNIVNEKLTESFKKHKEISIKSRLDVVVKENMYVVPWEGFIELELPVSIQVKEEEKVTDADKKALSEEFNKLFFKDSDKGGKNKIKDVFDGKIEIEEKEDPKPSIEEEEGKSDKTDPDPIPKKSRLFKALSKEEEKNADIT